MESTKIIEIYQEEKKDNIVQKTDIFNTLIKIGVNPKYKGFRYIADAVELCIKDPSVIYNGITKVLYRELAKMYSISPYSVERDIRTAIDWIDFTDFQNIVFGSTYIKDHYTNKEFITYIYTYFLYN